MGEKIRVAIVGVGNCASSLIQGIEYYKDADPQAHLPGLMHVELGGYHVRDIEISAAFDVSEAKVGKDVAEAIFAAPNNTIKFAEVPNTGVVVRRGETLDGLGKYLHDVIDESPDAAADVVQVLRDSGTQVVICYLPVGSERAAKWYAQQALDAGCAFVNCIPVFIASDPEWEAKFRERNLPIVGDDIKSQVGATIAHRVLTNLFRERGVHLDKTYQLNFGGNTDFMNMLERERLESKKISKTGAVTSQFGDPLPSDRVHVGPSDYVPWLEDRKWCHIYMEGTTFGGVPLKCELKLEVWDSPNSAGVVIDAVRCARVALDRGIGGAVESASSYFMKTPPRQYTDNQAREMTEEFIRGEKPGAAQRDSSSESALLRSASSARSNSNGNGHGNNGYAASRNGHGYSSLNGSGNGNGHGNTNGNGHGSSRGNGNGHESVATSGVTSEHE